MSSTLKEAICEVCGRSVIACDQYLYDHGWDFPPKMGEFRKISPRNCGQRTCGIKKTVFWKLVTGETTPEALTADQKKTLTRIFSEPESITPENRYVHYGSNNLREISEIRNGRIKPSGGLWSSPLNSPHSWKQWCIEQQFHENLLEKSFTFSLTDDAVILLINGVKELENLPDNIFVWNEKPHSFAQEDIQNELWRGECYLKFIDFEKLAEKFDGMELRISEEPLLEMIFYSWDCDSLLIWNKGKIKPID